MLAEIFTQREIEGGVAGEIGAQVGPAGSALQSVAEAGAVVDVGGGECAPRESDVAADVEGVALVVIERSERRRGGDVVEAAGDDGVALGDLVGVGQVQLDAVGDAGRAQGELPGADEGVGDGDGKEDVGGADVVVVEKIGDIGFEGVGVEDKSAERDGDAELMFFVALAMERDDGRARFGVTNCSSGPETVSRGGAW